MKGYKNAYYKLFNAITDIAQELNILVKKIEIVQLECEERIITTDEIENEEQE